MRRIVRRGFSLVELLVVIVIISMLVGMLLPAVQRARAAARRSSCQNNLRQIGVACLNFEGARGGLPPCRYWSPAKHGWATVLLPYMERKALFDQYQWDKGYDHPDNQQVVNEVLPEYVCPSTPRGKRFMPIKPPADDGTPSDLTAAGGDYVAIYGRYDPVLFAGEPFDRVEGLRWGAMGDKDVPRPITDIIDGTSHTVMVSEQAGRPDHYILGIKQPDNSELAGAYARGHWAGHNLVTFYTYGSDGVTKYGGPCSLNCNSSQSLISFHERGVNAVFADGSVHFLSDEIHPLVAHAAMTMEGQEVLEDYDDL